MNQFWLWVQVHHPIRSLDSISNNIIHSCIPFEITLKKCTFKYYLVCGVRINKQIAFVCWYSVNQIEKCNISTVGPVRKWKRALCSTFFIFVFISDASYSIQFGVCFCFHFEIIDYYFVWFHFLTFCWIVHSSYEKKKTKRNKQNIQSEVVFLSLADSVNKPAECARYKYLINSLHSIQFFLKFFWDFFCSHTSKHGKKSIKRHLLMQISPMNRNLDATSMIKYFVPCTYIRIRTLFS